MRMWETTDGMKFIKAISGVALKTGYLASLGGDILQDGNDTVLRVYMIPARKGFDGEKLLEVLEDLLGESELMDIPLWDTDAVFDPPAFVGEYHDLQAIRNHQKSVDAYTEEFNKAQTGNLVKRMFRFYRESGDVIEVVVL